jgi:histidinol-phosphate aminotransferase
MLSFIRSDLAQLKAYTPHPEETLSSDQEPIQFDHLDTNENPRDLPEALKQKLAWSQPIDIRMGGTRI